MRDATTIARRHGEKSWELLYGPDTPVVEQHQHFRELRKLSSHGDFATVRFQEKDQPALTFHFPSEAEVKSRAEQKARDDRANAEYIAGLKKKGEDQVSAVEAQRAKEHKEIVDAHSKNIERISGLLKANTPETKPKSDKK